MQNLCPHSNPVKYCWGSRELEDKASSHRSEQMIEGTVNTEEYIFFLKKNVQVSEKGFIIAWTPAKNETGSFSENYCTVYSDTRHLNND